MERLESDFKPKFLYKVENVIRTSRSEEEESMEDVKPDIVDAQSVQIVVGHKKFEQACFL